MEFRKMVMMILYTRLQKRHRGKNRLLDSVGEGEEEMVWENSIETCMLPYVKQMTSASLMHEAGHSKPVLWDKPEGSGVEGWGGGGSGWAETSVMWLIHVDVWQKSSQYCKVIILQLK